MSSSDAPRIYTPSRLNREARGLIENRFGVISLEGEITNFSRAASGHCYFSLKDDRAQVSCAMFRGRASRLKSLPVNGDQVLVTAEVSLYEARGNFQLIVQTLASAGVGALQAQFEALKKKLAAEGLFDSDRKRTLPPFPQRLGVISSPTGAAFRDVISVLRRRYPPVHVTLYPSPVQGEEAASELRRRVVSADSHGHDVLLITRGGGSLEDLWAFNDEALARAISKCRTPTVSAVGHEIDFTICDFVADHRAATPSAAAEALVPNAEDLKQTLRSLVQRARRCIHAEITQRAQRLDSAERRLAVQNPVAQLRRWRDGLHRLQQRLVGAVKRSMSLARTNFASTRGRLVVQSPAQSVRRARDRAQQARPRLERSVRHTLAQKQALLAAMTQRLNTLGPESTLKRGYAILVNAETGKVVRSTSDVAAGMQLRSRVADGEFESVVS